MFTHPSLATLGTSILIASALLVSVTPATADELPDAVAAGEPVASETLPAEPAAEDAPVTEETPESAPADPVAPDPAVDTAPEAEPALEPAAELPPGGVETGDPGTPQAGAPPAESATSTPSPSTQRVTASFVAQPVPDDDMTKKVEFCHATASETNPYNVIETSVNAFFQAGHDTHQNFEDIVPPFSYVKQGDTIDFPGLNWDAEGQAIFEAGCSTPDDDPLVATAVVTFTPATCSAGEQLVLGAITNATWGSVTDPDGDLDYRVVATAVDGAEFAGGWHELVFEGELDPVDVSEECDNTTVKKIEFCHATGSEQNPYVLLETSVNAFFQAGHDTHQDFEDIVPPFSYVKFGEIVDFPGLNWNAEGQAMFDNGCGEEVEPAVATASVTLTDPTCEAGQAVVLGDIVNATWGPISDPEGSDDYSVTATAVEGAEFAGGLSSLTFEGELEGPLDPLSPECNLPVLSLVLPAVTFTQFTCDTVGTVTLGVAEGYDPSYVTFTVNGEADIAAGTYPAEGLLTTVTAQAVAPHQLEPEWTDPAPFLFTVPTDCVPTPPAKAVPTADVLAFTGGQGSTPALGIGAGILLLGLAAYSLRRRFAAS